MKKNNVYQILEDKMGKEIGDYRRKWNEVFEYDKIFDFPLHINFELIEGCNLKCEYCVCSVPLKKDRDIISFDKYKDIIDEGVRNNLQSIELNGINEPLLQKDIIKYIQYAHDSGILVISLHTNATLLNENIADQLIKSGLTLLIFSLDAVKKTTYEDIRKGARYKNTISNIKKFLEIKNKIGSEFPLTKVSFVMNKVNQKEFSEFYDFWKDKVDFISSSDFCNPFIDDYDNYMKVENKYRLKSSGCVICREPFQRIFISSNGDICPCCSFFGKDLKIGNIYQNSISEVWNNKKMTIVREFLNNKGDNLLDACRKCRLSLIGIYRLE